MTYGGDPDKGQGGGVITPPVPAPVPAPGPRPIPDPGTTAPPPYVPPAPVDPNTGLPATPDQQDALAYIHNVLDQYGLGSEADWAWSQIVQGVGQTQLLQALRQRPAYQQRFQGMGLRQAAGLPAITEGEYIAYERQASQLMTAAGMPPEFRTPEYLAKLIGQDRSINELQGEISNAYLAVTQAPPEVRQAFGQYFGPQGDSALASFILDGSHAGAALEKMAQQAIVGGTGATYGFQVAQPLAEQIVQRGLTPQAQQTFGQLSQQRPFFTETASENQDLTEEQGIRAGFALDQNDMEAVRRRQEERAAAFGGSGGVQMTPQGAVGLGAARQ